MNQHKDDPKKEKKNEEKNKEGKEQERDQTKDKIYGVPYVQTEQNRGFVRWRFSRGTDALPKRLQAAYE